MFSVLVIRLSSLRLLRVSGIVMRLRMFLLLITFLQASHSFRNRLLLTCTTPFRSHMVPGHVEDDAARGGWVGVHHLDGLPRGEHRATQVHRQQSIELLGAGQAGGI